MNVLLKTQPHWLLRLRDGALTLLAWAGFFYLLERGIQSVLVVGWQGPDLTFGRRFLATMDTLLIYLLVAVTIGLLLFLWATYNQLRAAKSQRRSRIADVTAAELAESVNLPLDIVRGLQEQQVLILHHDNHGQLVAIERPGTGQRLAVPSSAGSK
jgi:biofilm PGA synthesis protein PgaD